MSVIQTVTQHIVDIAAKIRIGLGLKVCGAALVSVTDFLLGTDNHTSLLALLALVSFDMITAIMAKFKIGEEMESRKFLKTVTKTVVYGMMISAAHLTGSIVPGASFLDTVAISFLVLTEFISILENIGKMGYSIPNKLLNKAKELIKE